MSEENPVVEETPAVRPDEQLVQINPQAIIMKALEVNPTPEVLEKMMLLEREWRAEMARRAFVVAKSRFKKECPAVLAKTAKASFATKAAGQVSYSWTPLEVIIEIVTPHLANNGLDVTWKEEQTGQRVIRCTCVVSHEMGHSEENSLAAPPKENKLLSPAQEVATAVTSLRRYTLLGALGLATAEMEDSDGSSKGRGSKGPKPSKEQIAALAALADDDYLTPEQHARARQIAEWAKRGQRIDVQSVIDELHAASATAAEPPEPGSEG